MAKENDTKQSEIFNSEGNIRRWNSCHALFSNLIKLIYFLDDASEYDTLHDSGTAVFPH